MQRVNPFEEDAYFEVPLVEEDKKAEEKKGTGKPPPMLRQPTMQIADTVYHDQTKKPLYEYYVPLPESKLTRAQADTNQAFQNEFNKLLDLFRAIGIANGFRDHGDADDSLLYINMVKENFFKPEFSGDQSAQFFIDIKRNFEMIALFFQKKLEIPENSNAEQRARADAAFKANKRSKFLGFLKICRACGPGLHNRSTEMAIELKGESACSIPFWLADRRRLIINEYAAIYCKEHKVRGPFETHVFGRFNDTARDRGWFPLAASQIKDKYLADEHFFDEHKITEGEEEKFADYFRSHYTPGVMLERITTDFNLQLKNIMKDILPELKETKDGWIDGSEESIAEFLSKVNGLLKRLNLNIGTDFFVERTVDKNNNIKFNADKFLASLISYFTPAQSYIQIEAEFKERMNFLEGQAIGIVYKGLMEKISELKTTMEIKEIQDEKDEFQKWMSIDDKKVQSFSEAVKKLLLDAGLKDPNIYFKEDPTDKKKIRIDFAKIDEDLITKYKGNMTAEMRESYNEGIRLHLEEEMQLKFENIFGELKSPDAAITFNPIKFKDAIREQFRQQHRMLFTQEAWEDFRDEQGKLYLHVAAEKGDLECVKLLLATTQLKEKMGYEIFDKEGRTPLHYAVMKGHLAVAEIILKSGEMGLSSLVHMDNTGKTPMHYAIEKRDWQLAKLLNQYNLEEGIWKKTQLTGEYKGYTFTHFADYSYSWIEAPDGKVIDLQDLEIINQTKLLIHILQSIPDLKAAAAYGGGEVKLNYKQQQDEYKNYKINFTKCLGGTVGDFSAIITTGPELIEFLGQFPRDSFARKAILETLKPRLKNLLKDIIKNNQDLGMLIVKVPSLLELESKELSEVLDLKSRFPTAEKVIEFLNTLTLENSHLASKIFEAVDISPVFFELAKTGDLRQLQQILEVFPKIFEMVPMLIKKENPENETFIQHAVKHDQMDFFKYLLKFVRLMKEEFSTQQVANIMDILIKKREIDFAQNLLVLDPKALYAIKNIEDLLESKNGFAQKMVSQLLTHPQSWNIHHLIYAAKNKHYPILEKLLNFNEQGLLSKDEKLSIIEKTDLNYSIMKVSGNKNYELATNLLKIYKEKCTDTFILNEAVFLDLVKEGKKASNIIQALFDIKCDKFPTQDKDGKSILQIAFENKDYDLVDLFLKNKNLKFTPENLIALKKQLLGTLEEKGGISPEKRTDFFILILSRLIQEKSSDIQDLLTKDVLKHLFSSPELLNNFDDKQLYMIFLQLLKNNNIPTAEKLFKTKPFPVNLTDFMKDIGSHPIPIEFFIAICQKSKLTNEQKGDVLTWLVINKHYKAANNFIYEHNPWQNPSNVRVRGKGLRTYVWFIDPRRIMPLAGAMQQLKEEISLKKTIDENKNSLLHYLAGDAKGDVDLFNELCELKLEPQAENSNKENSLHIALKTNNFAIVKYLLDKHFDKFNINQIHEVRTRLEAKDCPEEVSKPLLTSIFLNYVRTNNFDRIPDLLAKNSVIDINTQDQNGNTLLHLLPRTDFAIKLIKDNPSLAIENKEGETFLSLASQEGRYDIVDYCVRDDKILNQFSDKQLVEVSANLAGYGEYDLLDKLTAKRPNVIPEGIRYSFYLDYIQKNAKFPDAVEPMDCALTLVKNPPPLPLLKRYYSRQPDQEKLALISCCVEAKQFNVVRGLLEDKEVLNSLPDAQAKILLDNLLKKDFNLAELLLKNKPSLLSSPRFVGNENSLINMKNPSKEMFQYIIGTYGNLNLLLSLIVLNKNYNLLKMLCETESGKLLQQSERGGYIPQTLIDALSSLIRDKQYVLAYDLLSKRPDMQSYCLPTDVMKSLATDTSIQKKESKDEKEYVHLITSFLKHKDENPWQYIYDACKVNNLFYINTLLDNDLLRKPSSGGQAFLFKYLLDNKQFQLAEKLLQKAPYFIVTLRGIEPKLIDTLLAKENPPYQLIKFLCNQGAEFNLDSIIKRLSADKSAPKDLIAAFYERNTDYNKGRETFAVAFAHKDFAAIEKLMMNKNYFIDRNQADIIKQFNILLDSPDTPKPLIYRVSLNVIQFLKKADDVDLVNRAIKYLVNHEVKSQEVKLETSYNKYQDLQYLVNAQKLFTLADRDEAKTFMKNNIKMLIASASSPDEVLQIVKSIDSMRKAKQIPCFLPQDDFIHKFQSTSWPEDDNQVSKVSHTWVTIYTDAKHKIIDLVKKREFEISDAVRQVIKTGTDLSKEFAEAEAMGKSKSVSVHAPAKHGKV